VQRRNFLLGAASLGVMAATRAARAVTGAGESPSEPGQAPRPERDVPVAFAIADGAQVIDFAGPWEVFQDVAVPGSGDDVDSGFRLFTVAETMEPVRATGGLRLAPDYTFQTAPQPRIIVVGAQRGTKVLHAWLKQASEKADLTMSVCTGAFQLARAGLLAGKPATTHHLFLDKLEKDFPDIQVKRGLRFVEAGPRLATAGGLTSGIDLALHVVDRRLGRAVAEQTASYMEYQSKGWIV